MLMMQKSLLLPQQVTRLRQLAAQFQLRRRTLVDILTTDPLRSKLEISKEQEDALRKAEKEIEEELAREIAELRSRGRDKLLSKLKRTQREQVEEIFGDAFEFSKRKAKKPRSGKPKSK